MSGGQRSAATDADLAREVAWAGRILAMGGHGDYTLGHVSARSADGRHVLMKPNGLGLEEVTPADMVTLDFNGERVAGTGRIHLEAVLHTAVYRARPDVGAVVHTHPPYTTAFGATDAKLELLNHDAVLFRDGLAYFDETAELIVSPAQGAAVAAALGDKRAVLMRGHGVLVTGATVPWAVYAALTLERVIRIQAIARSLGDLRPMTPEMAERVYPDKYRDDHVAAYWDYLIRQVRRAGLAEGMPGEV
ncbi:MAG TPA: class II aldolase/adducin family protein, partial [Thermomicrobiales bacterium]|nr:class II aldolase/adducin family protein [Thermomicrobiales bacterium]